MSKSCFDLVWNIETLSWMTVRVSDATTYTIETRAGRSIRNPHSLSHRVHACVCKAAVTLPPDPTPRFRISLLTWVGNSLFQAHHHNHYHNLHRSSQGRANEGSLEYSKSTALTLGKINWLLPPKMCNSSSNNWKHQADGNRGNPNSQQDNY